MAFHISKSRTVAELAEENDRLRKQLNIMAESYALLEIRVQKLTDENAGLKDHVERLTLDLFHTRG